MTLPRRYLLTLSSNRDNDDLVARAIADCARRDATLFAVYIVKPAEDNPVAKLGEQSFLGPGQTRDVAHEVKRTTLKMAMARLAEIERRASESGVACETDIVDGVFDEQTLKTAENEDVSRIYLSRRNRSRVSRLLFGSAVDRVAEEAECQVLLVKEEEGESG